MIINKNKTFNKFRDALKNSKKGFFFSKILLSDFAAIKTSKTSVAQRIYNICVRYDASKKKNYTFGK